MEESNLLYERIAGAIEQHIITSVLMVGDKLPSLRTICREHGVSMNTALQAFIHLEKKGLVESRPQSGYYVTYSPKNYPAMPSTTTPVLTYGMEDIEDIIDTVQKNRQQSDVVLSAGTPSLELLPVAKLNKAMMEALRSLPDSGIGYDVRGSLRLKQQVAKRTLMWNGNLTPNDIITTAGCMDAIAYSMLSVCGRGGTIAVESPVYFGILQLARNLGFNILELPTNAVIGIEVDALKNALQKRKINLCLLVSNFNNPLGSCMPDEHKKEVVKLLEHFNVPLIEDDEYGEFHLGRHRPLNCKTFDESGNVIWCGSFSKTLAPGYRVGWVSGGRFHEKISRTKAYHSVATNSLAQEAIAGFVENNRYDNHLRKLRQTLSGNLMQYMRCISEYFPEDTKVSRPDGGFVLWIELNKKADGLKLYDRAIQNRITFAPGRMYTLQNQYNNCFKLSFGLTWSEKIENALKTLGRLAKEVSK